MNKWLNTCQQFLSDLKLDYEIKRAIKLETGLNNTCFHIETLCGRSILVKKFDRIQNFGIVALEAELSQMHIVPKVLAVDNNKHLVAYAFIEEQTFDTKTHFESLVSKLKKLHSFKTTSSLASIDIKQLIYSFAGLEEFNGMRKTIDFYLDRVSEFELQLGCCHNDLVIENLLFDTNHAWLIDFEYVGLNDVYFDLAAISLSLKLDEQVKGQLLAMYFDNQNITKKQLDKLAVYQAIYNLICYFWYIQYGHYQQADAILPVLNILH